MPVEGGQDGSCSSAGVMWVDIEAAEFSSTVQHTRARESGHGTETSPYICVTGQSCINSSTQVAAHPVQPPMSRTSGMQVRSLMYFRLRVSKLWINTGRRSHCMQ